MENHKAKFKILRNTNNCRDFQNTSFENHEIENMILSAANLNKNSEVKVYFKNIPADEYTLGYKKFCGIKVEEFVFYNPSLLDLYPKFINFIYSKQTIALDKIFLKEELLTYFSENKNDFKKSKPLLNTDLFINLDISFDEMVKSLDRITKFIYHKKVLKILTLCYIKN